MKFLASSTSSAFLGKIRSLKIAKNPEEA